MSNWRETKINIGEVKEGTIINVTFNSKESLKNIKSITSSCGCSVPTYSSKTKILDVVYTPKSIPKHLVKQGFYKATKYITIVYEDEQKDILSFTSKITKK